MYASFPAPGIFQQVGRDNCESAEEFASIELGYCHSTGSGMFTLNFKSSMKTTAAAKLCRSELKIYRMVRTKNAI